MPSGSLKWTFKSMEVGDPIETQVCASWKVNISCRFRGEPTINVRRIGRGQTTDGPPPKGRISDE